MKIIVIGDIHGQSAQLNRFMKENKADVYIQTGEIYWPKFNTHEIIVPEQSKLYFCDGHHDDHWALKDLKNNEVYPRCFCTEDFFKKSTLVIQQHYNQSEIEEMKSMKLLNTIDIA